MATPKVTALLVAVATIGIAASIVAQDFQGQRREVTKPVIGAAPMQGLTNSADGQLASCLIVDNLGEITLGKLAQQRAKSEDVKQFAEMMVKKHGQFLQQLERFAGNEGAKGRVGAPNAGEAVPQPIAPETTDRPLAGATAQPMGNQPLNFVALKQEIGKKCLDLVQTDLKEKEGAQFDKCYIGSQIGMHMHVLAELEVFRNQASPELASVLDKGIETTKAHLEQAKTIAQALEK